MDKLITFIALFVTWMQSGSSPSAPQLQPPAPEPRATVTAPATADPHPDPQAKFDLASTGIEWHRGIDSVLGGDRPILLFQLLGDFDDAYC